MAKGRKHNATGRSSGGDRFVKLDHWMLQSAAWRSLTCTQRAVFVEACAFYNGSNNGSIILPVREIADRCNISKATAGRAIRELEDIGFLDCTYLGAFKRQNRKASEYRITLFKCDVSGHKATKRFMQYTAYETRSHQRDRTVSPEGQSKENCSPRSHQRDRNGKNSASDGTSHETQIIYQGGSGETEPEKPGNVVVFQKKEAAL